MLKKKSLKGKKEEFNEDLLIASLIKFGNMQSEDYYWDKMDWNSTCSLISVSGFPKEIGDKIWIRKRNLGEVH